MAEALKALFSGGAGSQDKHAAPHKDKLLQTKLREKEIKAALKEQEHKQKQDKEEEKRAEQQAYRFERAIGHNSKRFAKDERAKQKKEEHEQSGFMCEHGVWRCRICQPVTKHK